jgi:hypothetical protein
MRVSGLASGLALAVPDPQTGQPAPMRPGLAALNLVEDGATGKASISTEPARDRS